MRFAAVLCLLAVLSSSSQSLCAGLKDMYWIHSVTRQIDAASRKLDVKITIRDRVGELKEYTADFIVTDAEGVAYSHKIEVKGSAVGAVLFPGDFGASWKPGKYAWKCNVRGETVKEGSFEFVNFGVVINE